MLHDGGSENDGSSPPSCQDLPTQTLTLLNWCACSLSPSKAVWVQQKSKVTAEAASGEVKECQVGVRREETGVV